MKCPECKSDNTEKIEEATDGMPAEYECNECGEFFDGEEKEDGE